ncbi:MAG: PAS domain-containing protein [Rhodospirillaceae bacterium]|nr:PAS domain-containing protein [Rhodospirillaceae bacterium]
MTSTEEPFSNAEDQGGPFERVRITSVDQLQSKPLIGLFEYWAAKRGSRPYPGWREFDLMVLFEIAPYIHVRDVIDGGAEFTVRFWGTGLTDVLGFEGTGKQMREIYDGEMLGIALDGFQMVLEPAIPVLNKGKVTWVAGKEHRSFHSLVLPLAAGDGSDGGGDCEVAHLVTGLDFDPVE